MKNASGSGGKPVDKRLRGGYSLRGKSATS